MKPEQNITLKTKNIIGSGFVLLLVFVFGLYLGLNKNLNITKVTASQTEDGEEIDLSTFWKVWEAIDNKYPSADEVDEQERIFGAISGLVDSLEDPYSVFMDQDQSKLFKEEISGSFSGVGMEIGVKNQTLTVIAPLVGTPAYRAGIKTGDRILKIGDALTRDLTVDEAVKLIRGEKGTEVVLTVLHQEETEPVEIKIIRETIQIPTLETELRRDGIFVIKLYSFSANSTKLFKNAMSEFANSKADKLLLDLRGNPGGYLEAAVNISSWFLAKEKVVAIKDFGGAESKQKKYRSEGYNIFGDNLKFVILIDGGSASASEIVAGALHDHGRAKLVGEKSFGKGSVQEVIKVTKDTLLKITIAKWLTPNGTSISDTGLTPDYEVKKTKLDVENDRDPQLEKAVEILHNWYTQEQ